MPFEMPHTNVGSNIRRIEQNQRMTDVQTHKGTTSAQCQGFQNHHPLRTTLLHEAHDQRAGPIPYLTKERFGTLIGDAGSLMTLEMIQKNEISALDGRDLFVELEVESAQSGERAIIDQESSGATNPDQQPYRDPRTSVIDLGYKEPKGKIDLSNHHMHSDCPSVHIKMEQTTPTLANIDTVPRDKASADMSRSTIRVSSPVAEQFYRPATVKVEEDEFLKSNDHTLLRSNQEPSIPTTFPNALRTSRMSRKAVPTQRLLKEEAGERTCQSYYVPICAASANTPFTPRALHTSCTTNSGQNLCHSYISHQYEAGHVFQACSASQNRHSGTSSPTLSSPDTKLSYLRALTPTPFSTPYGMVNHHPYESHLHFIPGTLLEGMLRRTRWASAVPRPASRRQVEAEQEGGIEHEGVHKVMKEGNTGGAAAAAAGSEPEVARLEMTYDPDPRSKTCAWYKLPFCTCCKWSITTVPVPRENIVEVACEQSRRLVPDAAAAAAALPTLAPAPVPVQWNRRGAEAETKVKWWRRLRGGKKARDEEAKRRLANKKGEGRGETQMVAYGNL
ncbi:hypothetical protein DDE82_004804 [Stemphylium lycopersici]|uniref:Uncharacterized protein n=1 Tax=Stemphylium lycopersici TaxID=183478 RepID=A0A364N9I8_STELY|nr:hypothetical protein TW65_05071 [Stemphylium lycopersici]RAR03926.1 hypothetical protein DDE82_004804 [Stemphylium lycopersici]RAR13857.1 hypothetical protein DDE83_002745 [Stemphylium lycopersici]